MPEVAEEEEDEGQILRKLKPKIPDHNDAHPVAENMKLRKDAGLRQWRLSDPYAIRRRTVVDYRFHTKEQQDFYETVLLDKKPIVCDMRWVDWKFMKENVDHYPGVFDNFKACGVDEFVGQKFTNWNDELVMQFYSTCFEAVIYSWEVIFVLLDVFPINPSHVTNNGLLVQQNCLIEVMLFLSVEPVVNSSPPP